MMYAGEVAGCMGGISRLEFSHAYDSRVNASLCLVFPSLPKYVRQGGIDGGPEGIGVGVGVVRRWAGGEILKYSLGRSATRVPQVVTGWPRVSCNTRNAREESKSCF